MPLAIIAGLVFLIGLLLVIRWFVNADPARIAGLLRSNGLRIIGIGAVLAVVLVMALTGRLLHALPGLILLAPFLMRLFGAFRRAKAALGPSAGEESSIETRILRMTLNHDTGETDGDVLEGAYAGLRLSGMTLAQLTDLLGFCWRTDRQAAALLEAYLDRMHGAEWREAAEAAATAAAGSDEMTEAKAYEVLGLRPGASIEEIKAAHRKMMKAHHPDAGGSAIFAARINRAKEILMQRAR